MKRRRRRDKKNDSPDRNAIIHSRSLTPELFWSPVEREPLRLIEDRRQYHPLNVFRPARQLSGNDSGPVTPKKARSKNSNAFIAHQLKFPSSHNVVVCVRRKQRKEVLHALKKTGRGSGRSRKRRNWYSKIGC